jgi:thioesterase domain-containing protein
MPHHSTYARWNVAQGGLDDRWVLILGKPMQIETTTVQATITEDMVAEAWEAVLHRKCVDRDTDFRQLRMSSNRPIRIVREIWQRLKIDLPVNVFYAAPTIRQMASGIRDGSAMVAPDLIRLRDGKEDAPLFLFPGGGGVLFELNDLVNALDWPGVIYGIPFSGLDGRGPFYDRFEQEAARSLKIIRGLQAKGPYRLVGYSIGGITALETARQIGQEGEEKIFLGLIDTPQNDHSWPLKVWVRFIVPKIARQVAKIFKRRHTKKADVSPMNELPREGLITKPDINPPRRGTQLEFRFRNPKNPDYPYYSPYWVSYHTPNYSRVAANACRMKGFYNPRQYEGRVFFFASRRGESLVCDPQAVWAKYLPKAEWIRLSGDHFSLLVGRRAARLASEITERLMQTAPP